MTIEQFLKHYPLLYHMANDGTWDSIQKYGLLSTTALLDLFGIREKERFEIESCHRPTSRPIEHPLYGRVVIRDQAPMREAALEKCLVGMNCQEWYELLNRKAFFWVTENRVQTLLGAKLYRNKQHVVITIDTATLLAKYAGRVTLCPINSGNTLYNPPKRGKQSFTPIADYPFEERRKMRGIGNAVAELTVDYSVPDLAAHAVRVERRQENQVIETVFARA